MIPSPNPADWADAVDAPVSVTENGNHQGGKHDAVDRRKCGEQDAESHAEHCETERPALAPASRKESAQDQCRHHGHGASDLQDSA